MEPAPLEENARRERQVRIRHVTFGLLFVAAGVILALNGLSIFYAFSLWPLLMVGIGLARLLSACCGHSRRSGVWLLAIGAWLTLCNLTPLGYRDTWPLLLVVVGGMIVWDAVSPPAQCSFCAGGHHAR